MSPEIHAYREWFDEVITCAVGYIWGACLVISAIAGVWVGTGDQAFAIAAYFVGGITLILTINRHRKICDWQIPNAEVVDANRVEVER